MGRMGVGTLNSQDYDWEINKVEVFFKRLQA